jgi:hypothetical protein
VATRVARVSADPLRLRKFFRAETRLWIGRNGSLTVERGGWSRGRAGDKIAG